MFSSAMMRNYLLPTSDGKNILVDIFAKEPFLSGRTGVLFIHGGGFIGGDKDQFLGAASYLALTKNAVCVTAQYRTAESEPYPRAVLDIVDTINWMQANSEKLGIDSEKIVIVGGSPGANIALLSVSDLWLAKHKKEIAYRDLHLILLNGIFDMEQFWIQNKEERESISRYMNLQKEEDIQSAIKEISPILYQFSNGRFDFLHGEEDLVVPFSECMIMAEKLKKEGNTVRVFPFKGKGHAWFNEMVNQYDVWSCIASCLEE